MGEEDFIAVTHFINPQLFWYHKIDAQSPGFKELQRIEESVQLLYTAKQSAAQIPYRPIVGEIVAIAFLSWNKFIRARVEYIATYTKTEDEYVVWALDYGFPFRTKRIYVRKLPESYAMETDHIRQGGVANVIPADTEFDFITTTNKLICKKSWSKKPVEMLEKVMNDAASISFIEMFSLNGGTSGTQYYGDLKIVNHLGVEFMASEYLIKLNTAIQCPNGFKEKLATLKTTTIPCWQTNSGDMKIIENKLNSLNINYASKGNFNLSGNLSEISCDNFAKQKVMDWRKRNLNLDYTVGDGNPKQTPDLDASDFSFDDSVSVNNYKVRGLHMTYEDTFMGCAGAQHESRRKKYHGKILPPKPSLEVFEVIPEQSKPSGEIKETHSKDSAASAPSVREKTLLELRKKRMMDSQNEKSSENECLHDGGSSKLGTQSEVGTEEYLQICKEINAHSTRLAKLKELSTRRTKGTKSNSETDQEKREINSNQGKDDKSESCVSSTKSSRLLLLQRIKKKHSKQFISDEKIENLVPIPKEDEFENSKRQDESVVSSHVAKLISMRRKVREKYSQQVQLEEDKSSEKASPDSRKQTMQQENLKFIEHVTLEKDAASQQAEDIFSARSSDDCAATDRSSDVQNPSQVSKAREEQLRNMRRMIRSNPFEVMTMVPGGYDVTKLTKRNNEETHWHTKKTTLNDSVNSNQSSSGGFHNSSDSNQSRLIARRTEHVEEQDFRLARSRKERKKSQKNETENERNLLDASLQDDLVPAPTILPKAVKAKNTGEVPADLLIFIEDENTSTKVATNLCKEEKLINLSDTSESTLHVSSSEVNADLPEAKLADVSQEKLINLSDTSESTLHVSSSEVNADLPEAKLADVSQEKLINLSDTSTSTLHVFSSEVKADSPGGKLLVDDCAGKELSDIPNEVSFDLMNLESPEKSLITSEIKESQQDPTYPSSETTKVEAKKCEVIEKIQIQKSEDTSSSSASSAAVVPKITLKKSPKSVSESSASMLKNPFVDHECSNPIGVGPSKQTISSSSSSTSSFVKINFDEAQKATIPVPLPPVTSKWRGSTSDTLNSPPSSVHSNKVSTSSTQPSMHTDSSRSDGNIVTNSSNARLPMVAGEASLKTNLIEHLVLAHSHVKVSPIENMTSAMFAPVVHREMENMRLTKMYRIQSYAWAHLIRGNSFFVVNPARTGKSWCYLPPICSMVNYRTESNELPPSYGPVAVIIAPSSVQVENITRQCRRLLASSSTKISVVPSYAFRNSEDVKIELHNGCGILIITPPSLRRLLTANESESLLNMDRIQFVVLDDVDMMLNQYGEFSETLSKFLRPVLRQESGKLHFQLVVTSKRWSRQTINLMKISSQPMLCIGDFLEAAVYAKAKISIKLQSKNEKMAVMIKFLEKCSYSVERVVIVCNTIDEVDEVEKNLIDGGLACLPFTERTPLEYKNLIHEWKVKAIAHEILITMDSVLPELVIQNATILIHYSLPKSWTKFNFRFSVFLQKHHNLIKNAFEKSANFVKAIILLDEDNNVQLPRLIEFMKHHGQLKHIHPDILNVASRVTAEREEARVKNGVLMCPSVLELGSCDDSSRCNHRHQLTKFDVPLEGIPTEGEVRLKILDVLSPTHYVARLLTHKTQGSWAVVRRSNEVTRFLMQMLLHFTDESAHVAHWPLKLNDMCVYKGGDTFHRCRLLEVPHILHENIVKVLDVKIKLIDSGAVMMSKSNALLVIPEKFVDFPAQAVDIRLSGVKPFDNERVWDTRSTRTVKNWIMTEVGENDCLQASINFTLMDTIWVQNLVLMEKLTTIGGYAIKVNVKRSLIGKEFAIADGDDHLVKKIALQNGLLKPEVKDLPTSEPTESPLIEENLMEFSMSISEEKDTSHDSSKQSNNEFVKIEASTPVAKKIPRVEVPETPKEMWMQMGLDELSKIQIGEFSDVEKFYIRLIRQCNDLLDLESLIKDQEKRPIEEPYPMQNCLAPRDGAYHRAKIHRLEMNSSGGEVQARIFFCDLGEFCVLELNELRCSSKELIEFIPFQAITCKLTGILCKNRNGKEMEKLLPKNSCVYFAYAVKEISKRFVPDDEFQMHNYEIILYECFPEKYDVQINKMLVEKGLAEYDPLTRDILENDSKATFTKADDGSDDEPSTLDFQQLLDHMQAILDAEDAENDKEKEEEFVHPKETRAGKILDISEDKSGYSILDDSPKVESQIPALKALYVCPRTTWYETMCMIFLVIHAPDINDYFLEVSPKRLMFSAYVGGELQVLVLDFLGYVEPEFMTHEIRGLNVVVRLVKSMCMKWPRLLETAAKYPWLTYNLNAIDTFQAEQMIEVQTAREMKRRTSTSSDSSDTSSSNPCENFTPIVNYDQLYDPMVEMF